MKFMVAGVILQCAQEARKNLISTMTLDSWDRACDAALMHVGKDLVAQHTTAETFVNGESGTLHRVTISHPMLLLTLLRCAQPHCKSESRAQ